MVRCTHRFYTGTAFLENLAFAFCWVLSIVERKWMVSHHWWHVYQGLWHHIIFMYMCMASNVITSVLHWTISVLCLSLFVSLLPVLQNDIKTDAETVSYIQPITRKQLPYVCWTLVDGMKNTCILFLQQHFHVFSLVRRKREVCGRWHLHMTRYNFRPFVEPWWMEWKTLACLPL